MAKRFANAERDIQEHPSLHQVSSVKSLRISMISIHIKSKSADKPDRGTVLLPGSHGTPSHPAYIVSYTKYLCNTTQLLVQLTPMRNSARPFLATAKIDCTGF